MIKKIYCLSIICLLITCISSCSVKEKLVYFQDTNHSGKDTLAISNYQISIKSGDLLSINVYGVDEEMSRLLNQNVLATSQLPAYNNGIAPVKGYLVDNQGYIDFPEIGLIQVGGLSVIEASKAVTNSVKTISNNAKVILQIQNFKITVLGDVKNPGTFNIPNERVSILEAIGIAGDLNITGERYNILVIRDDNGVKKEYRVDITKKDFFNSEVYYLAQNDVVYVEPNRAKRNSSIISSSAGVFISIASLIITTITLITR